VFDAGTEGRSVTDECIHGFPIELCDICAPRQRAEPLVPAVKPVRRVRTASFRTEPAGSAPRSTRASAPVVTEAPVRPFPTLRAHHWTHLDNLGEIVSAGAILASSGVIPDFDVSSPEARARRAATPTPDGATVADHVPFSLTPEALTWESLRTGEEDERWSEAGRRSRPVDFVMLVVPTPAFGASVMISDIEADDADARFAVGPDAGSTLLRRAALRDPELRRVELLAGPRVSFSAVAVVGVPNDRVRDDVRAVLADGEGRAPRVAVFPPWFRPTV
jgi:hypothetical protein